MPDFQIRFSNFKSQTEISEAPFFPVVTGVGEDATVIFNQGYVFDYEATTTSTISAIKVSGMEESQSADGSFYIQIVTSGSTVSSASLIKGDAPEPEEGQTNIFVAKLDKGKITEIKLRENIHWRNTSGETVLHPWKITRSATEPTTPEGGTEPQPFWSVRGSLVYSNNTSITIGDEEVQGDNGYVYLKIGRDSDSRAIEESSSAVEFAADLPSDDYNSQYVPLGYITNGVIEQLTFEEIRIHELMIVDNGEFKLAPFQLSSTTVYEPPP